MTIGDAADDLMAEMKQLGVRCAEVECPGGVMVVEWRPHKPSEAEKAFKSGFESTKKAQEAARSEAAKTYAVRIDRAVWETLDSSVRNSTNSTPLHRLLSRVNLEKGPGEAATFEELARWAVQMADADRLGMRKGD